MRSIIKTRDKFQNSKGKRGASLDQNNDESLTIQHFSQMENLRFCKNHQLCDGGKVMVDKETKSD